MADLRSSGGRLFVLDLSGGRVCSLEPDGSDSKTLITGCRLPDGLAVDSAAGYIYWTNMGIPHRNDGSIERADLDGGNRRFIIPEGATFTPKQLHLEKTSGKLYWSDREGMRVMRTNLDGSQVETLIQTGEGEDDRHDPSNWCLGIAVDPIRGQMYWTQKDADDSGHGRIFRASIDRFRGRVPTKRIEVDTLFERLPEPIDLELDLAHRGLYWTDRGDPPRGNTVSRTPIDGRLNQEIVLGHLMEGIGIALDVRGDRMFITDLSGSIYSAHLNGSEKRPIARVEGNLAGTFGDMSRGKIHPPEDESVQRSARMRRPSRRSCHARSSASGWRARRGLSDIRRCRSARGRASAVPLPRYPAGQPPARGALSLHRESSKTLANRNYARQHDMHIVVADERLSGRL